jgi:magnesium-transporting ATPase (P-type)
VIIRKDEKPIMGFAPNQQETQYAQSRAYGPAHWASLDPEAVMAELGASRAGLNNAEVAERLARYGHNTLPRLRRRPWYLELVANFIHLFALLLWAGAGLAWVAGMPQLAWAIIAVILINGLFSFWQEYQAERAAEALEALLPRQVTVRRDGQPQLIPTSEIAPGDLLLLSEGEATPADARLISAERLRLDVSSLTGESRPIPRTIESIVAAPDAGAVTLSNLVFAGTTVASGRGEAVAFATGANTEFGRIARLTQAQDDRPSPLQRELRRVTRLVTILAIAMGIAFFVIGVKLGGLPPASGFLFAIGIIVANVPEGLLPTLTLALALGVKRMARRRALVKRLSSVEALGATTLILTDKTGTLTENEMTARELWADGASYQLSGTGYEPVGELARRDGAENDPAAVTEMLRAAALCCDAHLVPPQNDQRRQQRWTAIGDPTEAAILAAAAKLGFSQEKLAAWPRLAELPFDSMRKRMTTIQRIDGDSIACVKGAPGEIFARCVAIRLRGLVAPFDDERRRWAEAAHDAMARRGLRVLAVAIRSVGPDSQSNDVWRVEDVERELTLLGLIAMEDPPRPEVPSAVAACRRAGVRVVMVTGDHGLTAAAISREIGLSDGGAPVVTGAELDSLDDGRLAALLDTKDVIFARVTPEHKLRLVEACQRKGEVVAVTGDGVNDAPALKRADIGVAMGITGTDVAREAADMVLADDNFASIVAAIEEGRAVYDNVRKFVTYIFASNIPEIVPFIVFVLFRIPLPLTVMQILAVDLGTDLLPALALGAESPEPDVMRRPPRPWRERLLNLPTLLRAYGWLGMIEAALSLGGYFFAYWLVGWRLGAPLPRNGLVYATATTMTLAGIVACQVGNAFACRSDHQASWRLGFASNRLLLIGIAVEISLLLLLIYAPPLQSVFGLGPLGIEHWLLLAAFGPLLLVCEEGRKAVWRRFNGRRAGTRGG